MPRELSGVIACLQQIEIALLELQGRAAASAVLEETARAVRTFFTAPSRAQAEAIEALLRRKTVSERAAVPNWFEETVTVDGHATTLAGLGRELAEVLEDLDA